MQLIVWLLFGILLGPSIGNVPQAAWLQTVSQIAGGAFLFFAGWEMRFLNLRTDAKFYTICFAGAFGIPFVVGYFALSRNIFLGLAMGISALPVAVQILKEKGRYNSDLARKTITVACLCDIAAWLIMAFIFPSENLSKWITSHWIIFAFFGGLLLSRFLPMKPGLQKLQAWMLAPLFFIGLGWKIPILSLFNFTVFLKILVVAVFAKTVGVYTAARLSRLGHVASMELTALLNARGAMEIVAANVAYAAGLIEGAAFAALVALGVVTSVMAIPLIRSEKVAA